MACLKIGTVLCVFVKMFALQLVALFVNFVRVNLFVKGDICVKFMYKFFPRLLYIHQIVFRQS